MQNISKERKRDREIKKPISKKNLFPHYIIYDRNYSLI